MADLGVANALRDSLYVGSATLSTTGATGGGSGGGRGEPLDAVDWLACDADAAAARLDTDADAAALAALAAPAATTAAVWLGPRASGSGVDGSGDGWIEVRY